MPQMGESIAEGTIVRWIKKVGDQVDRDEPLFEISTDKVDAEIPVAGGRRADRHQGQGRRNGPGQQRRRRDWRGRRGGERSRRRRLPRRSEPALPEAAAGQPEVASAAAAAEAGDDSRGRRRRSPSTDDLRRQRSSPLVRRIAKEHDVDIRLIKGTGISGRVTKQDILGFIESGKGRRGSGAAGGAAIPAFAPGESVKVVPMSVMRRKIAEHMVLSAHTSPHVYSVYEVNFARVARAARGAQGRRTRPPARS